MPNTKTVLNGTQKIVFFYSDRYLSLSESVYVLDLNHDTGLIHDIPVDIQNGITVFEQKQEVILDTTFGSVVSNILSDYIEEFQPQDLIEILEENDVDAFVVYLETNK